MTNCYRKSMPYKFRTSTRVHKIWYIRDDVSRLIPEILALSSLGHPREVVEMAIRDLHEHVTNYGSLKPMPATKSRIRRVSHGWRVSDDIACKVSEIRRLLSLDYDREVVEYAILHLHERIKNKEDVKISLSLKAS